MLLAEGSPLGCPQTNTHPCPLLAGGGGRSGLEAGSIPLQLGLVPCPQRKLPRLRSWLVSVVRSLVGSLEPLAMSVHDYPTSHLGNTRTGEEATETSVHPEESVQGGILGDAGVYKEAVMARKDEPWHARETHLPSSSLGEECQGTTPGRAGESSGDSSAWRGRGVAGNIKKQRPRNRSGT